MKVKNAFQRVLFTATIFGGLVVGAYGAELSLKQSNGRFEVVAICHETYNPRFIVLETNELFFLVHRKSEDEFSCYEGELVETAFPLESVEYTWKISN